MSLGIQLRLSSLVVSAFTTPLALYNENAFYCYHFFNRHHDTFLAYSPLWCSQDSLHIHTVSPLSGTYFCTTVTEHTVPESLLYTKLSQKARALEDLRGAPSCKGRARPVGTDAP